MNKAECFNLGHVAKLHGYKGEVSLFFDTTNPSDYETLDAVFIDIDELLTPFFVEEIQLRKNGFAQVKFEGLDSEDDARKLLQKKLFLPIKLLPELTGSQFYDHEIIDFKVIDENYGEVGVVQQVLDFKMNPLLQVFNEKRNKEVLLPLKDDLVQKVDREKKELSVKTPEGLIAMYLEEG
jgi:16S rRNA processing protein RimM